MESHRIGETGLPDSGPSSTHHHLPLPDALFHGMNNNPSTSFMNQEGPAFDFVSWKKQFLLRSKHLREEFLHIMRWRRREKIQQQIKSVDIIRCVNSGMILKADDERRKYSNSGSSEGHITGTLLGVLFVTCIMYYHQHPCLQKGYQVSEGVHTLGNLFVDVGMFKKIVHNASDNIINGFIVGEQYTEKGVFDMTLIGSTVTVFSVLIIIRFKNHAS